MKRVQFNNNPFFSNPHGDLFLNKIFHVPSSGDFRVKQKKKNDIVTIDCNRISYYSIFFMYNYKIWIKLKLLILLKKWITACIMILIAYQTFRLNCD